MFFLAFCDLDTIETEYRKSSNNKRVFNLFSYMDSLLNHLNGGNINCRPYRQNAHIGLFLYQITLDLNHVIVDATNWDYKFCHIYNGSQDFLSVVVYLGHHVYKLNAK